VIDGSGDARFSVILPLLPYLSRIRGIAALAAVVSGAFLPAFAAAAAAATTRAVCEITVTLVICSDNSAARTDPPDQNNLHLAEWPFPVDFGDW
jgi:hypothetical protein